MLRANEPFWARKWHILITLDQLWDFFENFEEWKIGAIWSFCPLGHSLLLDELWSNWGRALLIVSLNSQDMISFLITTGSLNSQDMIRVLKQWRHDFSGKHLCDGYCMDVMWSLSGGQNSRLFKASLRICYVRLSECKGHWMLKTVINCHVWNRRLQN